MGEAQICCHGSQKVGDLKARRLAAAFCSLFSLPFPIFYFAACLDPVQNGCFSIGCNSCPMDKNFFCRINLVHWTTIRSSQPSLIVLSTLQILVQWTRIFLCPNSCPSSNNSVVIDSFRISLNHKNSCTMDNNSSAPITHLNSIIISWYVVSSAFALYIQIYSFQDVIRELLSCAYPFLIIIDPSYVISAQKSKYNLYVITKNYSFIYFSIVFSQNYAIVYFREILQYLSTLDERKY